MPKSALLLQNTQLFTLQLHTPQALKASAVRHKPNFQNYEIEKKKLRTAFSCLSSISMHQKEVSLSSLFLHSHYKGCLPPWELKTSKNSRLKEG
ncbi:hypothetical protein CK203_104832 [Vitis vinifera]|uniref:Uncharacterized protein n=1 Tax=Vitis vinifera TaxID=29760 RepID=A0A438CDV8_VITVI|nr:hypothetical protein CK203_104832 [Vitis vinifera]